MTYTLPFGFLSPTQVTRYISCPRCYELEYIERAPRPVSVALPLGGAIHHGLAWARINLQSPQSPTEEDVISEVLDYFDNRALFRDPESGVEVQVDLGRYESLELVREDVERMARFVIPEVLKMDLVRGGVGWAEVELSEIDADPGWPFPMKGKIDALYPREGEVTAISDFKTSSRQASPEYQAAIQGGIYLMPWWKVGQRPAVFFDVMSKGNRLSVRDYPMRYDDASMQAVWDVVLEAARGISEGRFPIHPTYMCSYVHGLPDFTVTVQGFGE